MEGNQLVYVRAGASRLEASSPSCFHAPMPRYASVRFPVRACERAHVPASVRLYVPVCVGASARVRAYGHVFVWALLIACVHACWCVRLPGSECVLACALACMRLWCGIQAFYLNGN